MVLLPPPCQSPLPLQVIRSLEMEPDINQELSFFSYEHFYVLYCKFWKLDTDHDLIIDAKDLSRHEDHGASTPHSPTIHTLLSHTQKDAVHDTHAQIQTHTLHTHMHILHFNSYVSTDQSVSPECKTTQHFVHLRFLI